MMLGKIEMKQDRAVCTIIAKNYVSAARTLCHSFLSQHPNYKCYVLIVDDFEGYIDPLNEPFEIVTLSDLEIPNLTSFCFKYNVTELCTAAKPFLLEKIIKNKNVNKLLYIDPDILVTNSLSHLYEKLNDFDIILTPHIDTDYPEDNLLPDDGSVLKTGLFNLGFIGVNSSENAMSFLGWWKTKLYTKCVIDMPNGYFVDQKFVDLALILFDNFYIEKSVGYNVAFWNLHSRQISRINGVWMCNDEPLYFFHFSSYHPETPDLLTGHIKDSIANLARQRLSDRPDLHQLFSEYREQLVRNGYEQSKNWPYSYAYFRTGEMIPYELRVEYRNGLAGLAEYDDPFESPAKLERAVKTESQTDVHDVPEILISIPFKYIPGLRYAYKRLFRRKADYTEEYN